MILTQSGRDFYNATKDNYSHIISLVCPDETDLVNPLHSNHLILKMWDIDKELTNKFRRYDPPSDSDCKEAIIWSLYKFEESLKKHQPFNLLVHCDAGVSRSSAVSLGVLWMLSYQIFGVKETDDTFFREWLEARKHWCAEQVDDVNSVGLFRFIEGRFNPGVKPNQAVLKYYRGYFRDFPW